MLHSFALGALLIGPLAQDPAPRPAPPTLDAPSPDQALYEHYRNVGQELAAADVAHLTPAQRAARAVLLEHLARYREARDFGRLPGEPVQVRDFRFVDDGGRRCAVAYLLDRTGGEQLTLEVARLDNDTFVAELDEHAGFRRWLSEHGLTLTEAARIQAPGMGGPPPPDFDPPGAPNFGSGAGRPAGPGPASPGPSGPASPGPAGPARPTPAPDAPPAPRTGGSGPASPASPPSAPGPISGPTTGGALPPATAGPEDWELWWRANRDAYLPRGAERVARDATGRSAVPTLGDGPLPASLKARWVERFRAGLTDPDALVRAASAVALARVQGGDAVPELLPLLDDPQQQVRLEAVLALGATGSTRALSELVSLASTGTRAGSRQAHTHLSRPVAVLALALLRANGGPAETDRLVDALASEADGADAPELRRAALIYRDVAGQGATLHAAPALAASGSERAEVRARALVHLGEDDGDEALATLLHELGDAHVDVRRATVVALGRIEHEQALPPLRTAYELERDHLTRGLLLVSIAHRGGPEMERFLQQQLVRGRQDVRPWAALALALASEGEADADLAKALVKAWRKEGNQDLARCYAIACGLAGNPLATDALVEELNEGGADARVAAAEGLTLLGTPEALAAVRARLLKDPCPSTRAVLADLVGRSASRGGADVLGARLEEAEGLQERTGVITALGWQGDAESLARLDLAFERWSGARERASTLRAAGLALSDAQPLRLQNGRIESPVATLATWLDAAAATGL